MRWPFTTTASSTGIPLNPKFVSYYLQTSSFHAEKAKHVARAKVKRISGKSWPSSRFRYHRCEEQERIVATLDKFDAPRQRPVDRASRRTRARRQQYEHYRDRLLTFEEAAA